MSYSNGLGNLLHLLGNIATNASRDAKRAEGLSDTASITPAGVSAIDGLDGLDASQFSSAGSLLGQSLTGPDVRLDKVNALQEAITNGTYHVSSADVAGSVLNALLT